MKNLLLFLALFVASCTKSLNDLPISYHASYLVGTWKMDNYYGYENVYWTFTSDSLFIRDDYKLIYSQGEWNEGSYKAINLFAGECPFYGAGDSLQPIVSDWYIQYLTIGKSHLVISNNTNNYFFSLEKL